MDEQGGFRTDVQLPEEGGRDHHAVAHAADVDQHVVDANMADRPAQ
jgi:hypothetical protein